MGEPQTPDQTGASRQDLAVVRNWLRIAEQRGEKGWATLMKRPEQEALGRILANLDVKEVDRAGT